MQILVIGGAGYIGSHMVQLAHRAGIAVVDLSSGHADAVADVSDVELVVGSLADRILLDEMARDFR